MIQRNQIWNWFLRGSLAGWDDEAARGGGISHALLVGKNLPCFSEVQTDLLSGR